jgi:hypothetical protein
MNYVDTTKTITHLSLCTGYEGIGRGLRRVLPNVREVAYVEIEAFAIANLVNKMEKGWLHPTPIYTNLKTFPYRTSGHPLWRIPMPTILFCWKAKSY